MTAWELVFHISHHPKSFSGQFSTFYISCKNVKEGKNCSSNLHLTVMRWHWHQYSQFYAENFLGWGAPKSSQQSTPVVINALQVKGTRLPKKVTNETKHQAHHEQIHWTLKKPGVLPWPTEHCRLQDSSSNSYRCSLGSKLHSMSKSASLCIKATVEYKCCVIMWCCSLQPISVPS